MSGGTTPHGEKWRGPLADGNVETRLLQGAPSLAHATAVRRPVRPELVYSDRCGRTQ